jgi:hypothetical protein
MVWVKACDYIFDADEVIAVGPIEPLITPETTPADVQSRVVLRAGFDFYLKGDAAQRFRTMFLDKISGTICDLDNVQVNETRVFRGGGGEGPSIRPMKADA